MNEVPLPSDILTAYHEAGHAVMAELCGQIVTEIEIVGDEEHCGSVSCLRFFEEPRWARDRRVPSADIEGRILVLVAGLAAESVVTDREVWEGHDDDLDEAVRLALKIVGACDRVEGFLREAKDHAADILRRHWDAVETLAGMLLIHRRIERDRIRRVVEILAEPEDDREGRVA